MKNRVDCLVVGAGPAGTGPLVQACRTGRIDELATRGLAVVDQSRGMALGGLGRYAIRSNSYATSFIECVEDPRAPDWLRALQDTAAYRWLRRHRSSVVPLPIVARFQRQLGAALLLHLSSLPGVSLGFGQRVSRLRRRAGNWTVELSGSGGQQQFIARKVLLATGGRQRTLPPGWPAALPARELFRHSRSLGLRERPLRRAAILGGSHSAWSAAWKLLRHADPDLEVTIICRRKPRAFFDSEQAALEAGYRDFDPDRDICPLTRRVFRLGGLRGDALKLFLEGHPRLKLQIRADFLLEPPPALLQRADLLVNALGYEPACPPVFNGSKGRVLLASPRAVDADCRLLRRDGTPLEGLYAMGLGMGYRLPPEMGGEPGFSGQTNGLWLYQNDVGERVVRQLLDV